LVVPNSSFEFELDGESSEIIQEGRERRGGLSTFSLKIAYLQMFNSSLLGSYH
jgi:hypothetical protein